MVLFKAFVLKLSVTVGIQVTDVIWGGGLIHFLLVQESGGSVCF